MYKTVVFDLDGTLLNSIEDIAAAGNHALQVLNMPTHHHNAYKKMVGNGVESLVEAFLPPAARKPSTIQLALHLFNAYYGAHMADLSKSYPGIQEMLAKFSAAGIKMAVLSNKANAYTCEIVQRVFPDIFACVHGLCEDYPKKPNPCLLLEILKKLDANPETTLFCGDSDVDMQTAKNAGLAACGVLWGFREKAELVKNGADFTVLSAEELEGLVFSV